MKIEDKRQKEITYKQGGQPAAHKKYIYMRGEKHNEHYKDFRI